MPGVSRELQAIWREEVRPRLEGRTEGVIIRSRVLKIGGMPESAVEQQVLSLLPSPNPTVATYVKEDGVHLRITAKARGEEQVNTMLERVEMEARRSLGDAIFAVDDESLADIAGRLLHQKSLRLAIAESCTGGLLSSFVTDVPGSSAYYRGGFVVYSAEAKANLGVPWEVLRQHGTVAAETTEALAAAVRRRLDADIGLAITGVAGPDAVEGKPVGTVFIAVDDRDRIYHRSPSFRGFDREFIKRRAALAALDLLRRVLQGIA
jgi:nicotinamide-nucleotide amidase